MSVGSCYSPSDQSEWMSRKLHALSLVLSVMKLRASTHQRKKCYCFFQKYFKSITIILEMPAYNSHLLEQRLKTQLWESENVHFIYEQRFSQELHYLKDYTFQTIGFHYAQMHNLHTERKTHLTRTSISESSENTLANQEGTFHGRTI